MKHVLSFASGAVIGGIILSFFCYKTVKESWYHQGFNDGSIDAKYHISEKLIKSFDEVESSEVSGQILLFSIKTTDIYIVHENGKNTIKVVP